MHYFGDNLKALWNHDNQELHYSGTPEVKLQTNCIQYNPKIFWQSEITESGLGLIQQKDVSLC